MLTIDKIKQYWFPLNISRKNNNFAYLGGVARYNDSINLYEAIKTVNGESPAVTDLTHTLATNAVSVNSSSGLDTIIPAATISLAGVMSNTDKIELNSLRSIVGNTGNDLDAFTGTIIPDNSTIKQALQSLESAIPNSLSYLLVDGGTHILQNSKLVYARTDVSNVTITLSTSMQELTPYYLIIRSVSGNNVTMQVSGGVMWVSGDTTETTAAPIFHSSGINIAYTLIRFGSIIFCLKAV